MTVGAITTLPAISARRRLGLLPLGLTVLTSLGDVFDFSVLQVEVAVAIFDVKDQPDETTVADRGEAFFCVVTTGHLVRSRIVG